MWIEKSQERIPSMEIVSLNKCFEGTQGVYKHHSKVCQCDMTFGLFLPPGEKKKPFPVLWFLSGLTCTHENAMTKAGAQQKAAELGMAIVFPDTSPRGKDVPDHDDNYLGQGAGFYVDATEEPWNRNFKMWSYIAHELQEEVISNFPVDENFQGITGHSMGGHGALTLALTMPETYRSVSAFSPIANPTNSDWGQKQFTAYFGANSKLPEQHDATLLLERNGYPGEILIDLGTDDQFMDLLRPDAFVSVMENTGQKGTFNMREGYDHGYFFVTTFINDHIEHHFRNLQK